MSQAQLKRERFLLLHDLRYQHRHGCRFKDQTERAIKRLEWELAEGRELAGKAATKD